VNSHAKILGLAVGQKSLLFAELSVKGSAKGGLPSIVALAEFPLSETLSLAAPVELGQAVARFLANEGITTRDVVMGLPARRLITRRKEVPPATPVAAAATLRLQAETEFAAATTSTGEPDTLVFDYVGHTSTSIPSSVLLVATAQSDIDQCTQFAKAANLKLRGITATSVALARAAGKSSGNSMILSLSAGAAELLVQDGNSPTQLRHLAIPNLGSPESLAALTGEIRRSVASLHRNGTSSTITLSLWDDGSQKPDLLEQRLGFPVRTHQLTTLAHINQAPGLQSRGSFAPAVAVAITALSTSKTPPIDFLHSRLAPPKESSNKRPLTIALYVVTAAILVIAAGLLDLHLKQNRLSDLNDKSLAHASEVKVAQTASNRLDEANRWIHRASRHVECLRDLTAIFPDEGTIWATSLSLSSANKGVLTGSAASEAQVRALKDLMLKSKNFINPITKTQETRDGTTFTISFDYKPQVKPAETQPARTSSATPPSAPSSAGGSPTLDPHSPSTSPSPPPSTSPSDTLKSPTTLPEAAK